MLGFKNFYQYLQKIDNLKCLKPAEKFNIKFLTNYKDSIQQNSILLEDSRPIYVHTKLNYYPQFPKETIASKNECYEIATRVQEELQALSKSLEIIEVKQHHFDEESIHKTALENFPIKQHNAIKSNNNIKIDLISSDTKFELSVPIRSNGTVDQYFLEKRPCEGIIFINKNLPHNLLLEFYNDDDKHLIGKVKEFLTNNSNLINSLKDAWYKVVVHL